MSSHDVTILGFLIVLAAGIVLELLAVWTPAKIPPLGDIFNKIMRSRTGRVGMLIAWAWIGLHFFAR